MVYAGIETSKRDCQCKCLRIVQGLPEPGNKYNNAHLKVSLEGAFSEVTQGNKKVFIFLDNECSASVEIICFEHLQLGFYEKPNPGMFLQEYVQPNAPQVATVMALWKLITVFRSSSRNFAAPNYGTYLVRQSL